MFGPTRHPPQRLIAAFDELAASTGFGFRRGNVAPVLDQVNKQAQSTFVRPNLQQTMRPALTEVHMSNEAFICDAVRTPIGRYAGVLSGVRADDLAAVPIAA